MKTNLVFGLTVLLSLSVYGQYDFRKTKWMMTREQVIMTEKDQIWKFSDTEKKGPITMQVGNFMTKVAGVSAGVYWTFVDNKLMTAWYEFHYDKSDKEGANLHADSIRETLFDKYGENVIEKKNNKIIWITSNSQIEFVPEIKEDRLILMTSYSYYLLEDYIKEAERKAREKVTNPDDF